LPRQGDAMPLCNAKKVRVYASDNAGTSTTAKWLATALCHGANENVLCGTLVMVAHSGDGDDDNNSSSGSDSNVRGCIAEVG